MTFKIGAITLPIDPYEIEPAFELDIREIAMLIKFPMLLGMGPKVPVFKLKGTIAENGQDAAYLETNYLLPLRNMVLSPASFPFKIADDNQAAFWTLQQLDAGSLGFSLSNDTSVKIKGADSLKVTVGAGSFNRGGVSHTFASNKDWSKKDFISLWLYGANSTDSWWLEFYCPDVSNKYQTSIVDNFTGWKRIILRLPDQFSTVGSPDWSNVATMYLTSVKDENWNLDRTMIGVGHYIDGPGSRYDGLYILVDFKWTETYKDLELFPYELDAWLEDDYY